MKKGFTLMELLAVVIILSLLTLITINAVTNILTKGKEEITEKQMVFLQKSAQLWGIDNADVLPSSDTPCEYITFNVLKRDGYVSNDAVDTNDLGEIPNDLKIAIRPSVNNGKVTYQYEVNPSNLDNCEYLYEKYKLTVAFNTLGGTEIASVRVDPGEKIQQPKNPQKHEYKFREWTLDNETYNFNTPVTSDITLTAEYDATDLYTLKTGQEFNKAVKSLANGSTVTSYSNYDYTVEYIEFYSNGELPEGITLSQLQSLPSTVVSSTGDTIKAYYKSANKTVYVYSSGEIVWNETSTYMFAYFRNLKMFKVPFNVTTIRGYAFYYCDKLTSVTISSSVTTIAHDAFGYSGLTSIAIPNGVTTIEFDAFYHCDKLTSVTISSSVTSLGTGVFSFCTKLESITVDPNNPVYEDRNSNAIIKKSNNELVAGCKSTIIPSSVTRLGSYAFYGMRNITSITIPNSVTYIGANTFYYCEGLTSITIPNSVTYIDSYAFRACYNLTSITIPSSVTGIGSGIFGDCTRLASITVDPNNSVYEDRNSNAIIIKSNNELVAGCKNTIIPNSVTSIGAYAFYGCSNLASITIPNSVTSIGNNAFYGCASLTSITIPNSVISIGNYAFYGCYNLASITIPNSVTSIGNYAFYGCSKLTSITIPSSVTSIGNDVFHGCSKLASITIPSSVTSIGNYAFYGCSSLTSITIPNSVTSLGNYVFYNCSGLESITIPSSVTSIGNYAFSGCTNLTSITFDSPTGWKYSYSAGSISGADITLSNASQNATYFKSTYR